MLVSLHCPQLWIISIDNFQHSMGMLQICMSTLGPSLCPGYLPEDDGPDSCSLWWSDWHHRQHCYPWKGWRRTWQVPHKLLKVACKHGFSFNSDKCAVKQPFVTFFGCGHDANGAHLDPRKVGAVHNIPAPDTATQLQKFLGMVTYLSPFVPSLSFTTPLCELLKKGTDFIWNESYQEASDSIKSIVCKNTTLWYFDVCKPVTVQVNASNRLLACDFGTEWFHTYMFFCAFTVESDHKLLEQINTQEPARYTIFRECCSDYRTMMSPSNIDLAEGMLVADTLSQYAPPMLQIYH